MTAIIALCGADDGFRALNALLLEKIGYFQYTSCNWLYAQSKSTKRIYRNIPQANLLSGITFNNKRSS